MKSLILQIAIRLLLPILLLYSIFLFLRGHHYSGGGFIGGLVASGAFALYALAHDAQSLKKLIHVEVKYLIFVGLSIAFLAGAFGFMNKLPFLTGIWWQVEIPRYGKLYLGTPLLFDLGVYLTVIGASLTILINLMEE